MRSDPIKDHMGSHAIPIKRQTLNDRDTQGMYLVCMYVVRHLHGRSGKLVLGTEGIPVRAIRSVSLVWVVVVRTYEMAGKGLMDGCMGASAATGLSVS